MKFDKEGILTEIETEAVHQTAAEMQNELEQIVDTVTEALGEGVTNLCQNAKDAIARADVSSIAAARL